MAWGGSKIFQEWVKNPMMADKASLPTTYAGLQSDSIKVALYGVVTPDRTAAVGSTGYNTGQWVTGGEQASGTDWVAGGRALASKTLAASAGVVTFDAADLTSVAVATLTVNGCLVYDDTITAGTVAKQGVCFLDFGGVQTVTSGSFSLSFNAAGIATITV